MKARLFYPIQFRHQAGLYGLLLIMGMVWNACEQPPPPAPMTGSETPATPPDSTETEAPEVTYLALGDSYTIGESVPVGERFPVQLGTRLVDNGFQVNAVDIIARTGWTTDQLLNGITQANLSDDRYNLVSLLIGVNNQYRGRPLENYQEEFEVLLQRAIGLAGNRPERVFVLSIPDYGVTPFVPSATVAAIIAQEIDAFNEAAAGICLEYEVPFFDITPISREAAEDRSLIASDRLHPSGKMYARWVELIYEQVREMVED